MESALGNLGAPRLSGGDQGRMFLHIIIVYIIYIAESAESAEMVKLETWQHDDFLEIVNAY